MLRFFGISKIWSYGLVIPILLLFLAIIDFPASACRAFVMIVLFLLASCFGRQSNAFNILGASGLILLIWYPGYAYDLGFILSFAAVIALIGPGYYCDLRFKEWLKKKEEEYAMDESFVKKLKITGKWIISPGIYSFWAWIGTAPLIAYYFKTFSAISVVSNLVAVLIMPLLLLCLILAILLGQISYIFALAYCHVADFLIKFLNWSFKIMVKIPGSSLNLNSFTKWDFLWSYALIAIFFIGIYSKTRKIQKITIKP
ncbi:MAG: hypothetical protein ACD_79C00808G0005 [uncultured bacterium]|nr:MAG: hypothetical protein ACD_79C00808G0005 [uncultured bacterium]